MIYTVSNFEKCARDPEPTATDTDGEDKSV